LVWQFSQGMVSGPCGLRPGCRWATAGKATASAQITSASQWMNRATREMIAPKRFKWAPTPHPK